MAMLAVQGNLPRLLDRADLRKPQSFWYFQHVVQFEVTMFLILGANKMLIVVIMLRPCHADAQRGFLSQMRCLLNRTRQSRCMLRLG